MKRLLLFAAVLLGAMCLSCSAGVNERDISDTSHIDPNGRVAAEGWGMDPNGREASEGSGIDPIGRTTSGGSFMDPNGGDGSDGGGGMDPNGRGASSLDSDHRCTIDPNG